MKKNKNFSGFTLIELLVVIGIILVIIGAVTNAFFSSLKGAARVAILNDAKQNGDYALSVMERMIRNAVSLETVCPFTNASSISIRNPDGGVTTFSCPATSGRIASNSGYLTSSKVVVNSASCYFSCEKSLTSSAPSVVKIFFTISNLTPSPGVTLGPQNEASIDFETSVVVRNSGF